MGRDERSHNHKVVSRQEWQAAREELLRRKKEHTPSWGTS
jgi:predicted dithiol-disulfide oxidoreductase (DUF899 family)